MSKKKALRGEGGKLFENETYMTRLVVFQIAHGEFTIETMIIVFC